MHLEERRDNAGARVTVLAFNAMERRALAVVARLADDAYNQAAEVIGNGFVDHPAYAIFGGLAELAALARIGVPLVHEVPD